MSAVRSITRGTRGVLSTAQQVEAVFANPALYELAAVIPSRTAVGRPAKHPGYLLLAFGVLARLFRSANRVHAELSDPFIWARVQRTVAAVAADRPELVDRLPGASAPDFDAFRHARNTYLTDPDLQAQLLDLFTEIAVDQARSIGLLDPAGPGSLCHPDRSRTVYGDGTVVRPLYSPPPARRTTDPITGTTTVTYLDGAGQPIAAPVHRFDPDGAVYHGHAGPVHGQNFVAIYARGDGPHQRVVLAVDRVERPGMEADTAVTAIKRVHAIAGAGIQAVVYDGAMRGRHVDDLMGTCGVVVINKVHASAKTAKRRGKTTANPRWFILGTWEHETPAGNCTHQLAAADGAVSEIGLDEDGKPVVLARLVRRQVKRPRRATGRFHFNVAYDVECPGGTFLAWVTPHALAGETDHRRADAVRVIAEGEADFGRLYGLRNDSESFNSQFKRSLLVDRAMSLGARRQLLDMLCAALLQNSLVRYRAELATASAPTLRLAA